MMSEGSADIFGVAPEFPVNCDRGSHVDRRTSPIPKGLGDSILSFGKFRLYYLF